MSPLRPGGAIVAIIFILDDYVPLLAILVVALSVVPRVWRR
jgi:hypothetical protein